MVKASDFSRALIKREKNTTEVGTLKRREIRDTTASRSRINSRSTTQLFAGNAWALASNAPLNQLLTLRSRAVSRGYELTRRKVFGA
jgi:hypothetical protein